MFRYALHFFTRLFFLLVIPLMLLFLTGEPAFAGETESLILPTVLMMAEDNNLSLREQELLIRQAESDISIQKTGYFPSLSASGFSSWVFFNEPPVTLPGDDDRVSINIFSVGISQPVFRGFRTINKIHMAEEQLDARKARSRSVHDRLLLQAGLLYYDLQLNLLSRDVLQQSLLRARNQLEKTRNLLAAEQVTWFDTLEVSNRMLEISTSLNELDGYFAVLKDKLQHLLNVSELPPVTLQPVTPPTRLSESIDDLRQAAILNRPELGAIKARQNLQQYQIALNKAAFYPVISASAGYNYGRLDGFFFSGKWIDFYNVMLTFQWDIWDWNRDRDKVQQSQVEYQRLDLEEQQQLLDITHEIKEAYEQIEINSRQIEMQNRLLKQEKDRYDITHERFQQGLTTALDLSSAEHALTSAQLQLHKSYIDWYKNNLRLQYATGQIGNLKEETDR